MNNLNTTAPITTVERRVADDSNAFPSLTEVPTAVFLKTAVLRRCRLQLCCGEFQRLLPLSALVLRLQFVLRLDCAVGTLLAERYFVILDFFFVILDVLEVISET